MWSEYISIFSRFGANGYNMTNAQFVKERCPRINAASKVDGLGDQLR